MKVGARFDDLKEIQGLWPKDMPVVGVGVTGFPRSALGYLLVDYMILCLLETKDLEAIRKLCPVVSLEKDLGAKLPEKFNSLEILRIRKARDYLVKKKGEGELGLFVYKGSKKSNQLAKEIGLKVLSTPGEIRMRFENKQKFRVEGEKAGINLVPGETLLADDLDEQRWDKYRQGLGERLVFQLPDYTVGGGFGTFFINKKDDFKEFKEFVERRREVREIKTVNVTKFIEGEAASITGCATRHGVVTSLLQKQIMDQPELVGLHGRSGVWLGHDWYMRFSEKEQLETEKQCQRWGEYIYKQGYRGIYGLDVVVDKEGKMWPIECNSRYTGAFPVYTMMQLDRGEMPMDVWHLLEWLGVDYEMDLGEVQAVGRQPKEGAHFLLHNIERKFVTPTKEVKAGVYRVKSGGIEWVREGFSLLDIKDKDELVLADKVASQYTVLKPAERLGRLMFKRKVVDGTGRLLKEIREIVKQVYSKFELMPVERPEGY